MSKAGVVRGVTDLALRLAYRPLVGLLLDYVLELCKVVDNCDIGNIHIVVLLSSVLCYREGTDLEVSQVIRAVRVGLEVVCGILYPRREVYDYGVPLIILAYLHGYKGRRSQRVRYRRSVALKHRLTESVLADTEFHYHVAALVCSLRCSDGSKARPTVYINIRIAYTDKGYSVLDYILSVKASYDASV